VTNHEWWRETVFYQVYPRSFQDSNGDGMGDIPGIIARLDAIAALGAGAIWLSPVYKSPDADNGYDIADYEAIDPRYGTLDDFGRLVAEAAKRDIKIVMDLVVNHTSDEHAWFQASRRREPGFEDFYIWADEPNNWTGFFMKPAWTYDSVRGQYYLHLFDAKQPDLNWRNPAVKEAVKQAMRFWLDRGVAGFRCDVINLLWKSSLADGKQGPIKGLEHYRSQPGLHPILRELRSEVLAPAGAFTVGESVMPTLQDAKDLTDPERGELDLIFYFDHLQVDRLVESFGPRPFSAERLLDRLTTWQTGLDWNAVYLENHDQPRIVSHYGDDERFRERSAMALAVLLLTLRGTPFIYQGQEIGMTNTDLKWEELDDVQSKNLDGLLRGYGLGKTLRRKWILDMSRDNARTPVQWDATANAGFTTGTPWLPVNSNYTQINYAAQEQDPRSVLSFYRRLVTFRQGQPALRRGSFAPVFADRHLLAFRRALTPDDVSFDTWVNFSGRQRRLPPAFRDGAVVVTNTGRSRLEGKLQPWEAVVIAHD
jgi:oligo-1,6-glucosidase